jgi:iron complex transport system ATP-binding protein
MHLVDVHDASFSYGAHRVFEKVSFTVDQGEIFCLLGPNGCGKTTLLDCILGFHACDSGSISICGRSSKQLRPAHTARHMSYVPQKHESTFPYRVIDVVSMGRAAYLGIFQAPSRNDFCIAAEALERLGIEHLSDRPYTQLSGGESRLVMIARALVQKTPIIIMDEPTAHLDFHYELLIMEVITGLVRDSGISVIMATHFPNHAFYFQNNRVKTRVALLHNGSFLSVGSPDEVIDTGHLKSLYGVDTRIIALTTPGTMKHIIPLRTAGSSSPLMNTAADDKKTGS